jgi:hypothetical protein
MAKHKFRVTVEYIADNKGNPVEAAPLTFETENHDNILDIAARRASTDKQRSFVIGLKLFGETLLEERDNPLFASFRPHFGEFMKAFKASKKTED